MQISIDKNLRLELVHQHHAETIYQLADANRVHLSQWLPWVNQMKDITFIQNFIEGSIQRNIDQTEYAFVIFNNEMAVGRIGIYYINKENNIGEIGYWIAQDYEGKGIITKSCEALIQYAFEELKLNRLEIKCAEENMKSQTIPQRLHFTKEGLLKQAQWLHDKYINIYLFAKCRNDV